MVPNSSAEIKTIRVWGFPRDVRKREITNVLKHGTEGLIGYEIYRVEEMIVAFALYEDFAAAESAVNLLNNMMFDVENDAVLYAEMGSDVIPAPFAYNRDVSSPLVASPSFDERYYPKSGAVFFLHLDKNLSEHDLIKLRNQFSSLPGYQFMDIDHQEDDIVCYVMFEDEYHAKAAKAMTARLCFPPSSEFFYPVPHAKLVSLSQRSKELNSKMNVISSPSAQNLDVSSPFVASPSSDERDYLESDMFIVHLDKNVSEDDLIKLREQFSSLPGYQFMDTDHREDETICYVMFEDEDQAKAAKDALSGVVRCGVIHVPIEFAPEKSNPDNCSSRLKHDACPQEES